MKRRDWTKVEPKSPYGRRLREARLRKGISQEELAKQARVTMTTIQRVETQGDNASRKTTTALSKVLGVTPAWLEHGSEATPDKHLTPAAVSDYLASPLGIDASAEVKRLLKAFNFATVGANEKLTLRIIHAVREVIETATVDLRQPPHGGKGK